MRSGRERRAWPLSPATIVAVVTVLVATVAAVVGTRAAIDDLEQQILTDRARDFATVAENATQQLEGALLDTGLAARLSGDDGEVFRQTASRRLASSPLTTLALVRRDATGWHASAFVGEPPLLLPGLATRGSRIAKGAVLEGDDVLIAGIGRIAGERVVAYVARADGSPDLAVYGELVIDRVVQKLYGGANGLEGALYLGDESGTMFAANTDDLPIRRPRGEARIRLLGTVPAMVYVRSKTPIVGLPARELPWLVLAGGVALALLVGTLVESGRRRRDRALLLARRDALTGLPNRRAIEEELARALSEPGREAEVALLLVDLDDFKVVNDARGHLVGDRLLEAIGARIRVAAGDAVPGRIGGDEFAMLVLHGGAAEGERIASQVLAALEAPVEIDGDALPVRASIGIAEGAAGATPTTLLRDADLAMYAAKARTSDPRFEHFSAAQLARATDRHDVALDLRGAVARGEFELAFQPMVRLDDGCVGVAEVLLRWRHPTRGLLAPGAFLDEAERNGEIVAIGSWVVEEAAQRLVELRRIHPELRLAVNVSRREILQPGFPERYCGAIARAGLPIAALPLEITERVFADDAALPVVAELRRRDVRVVLDDFGAAHSSLPVLVGLNIGGIKIDRALMPVEPTADDLAFLTALASMLHARGWRVIVEGVENDAALAAARAAGFDEAQGYGIARPMPLAALEAYLRERAALSFEQHEAHAV